MVFDLVHQRAGFFQAFEGYTKIQPKIDQILRNPLLGNAASVVPHHCIVRSNMRYAIGHQTYLLCRYRGGLIKPLVVDLHGPMAQGITGLRRPAPSTAWGGLDEGPMQATAPCTLGSGVNLGSRLCAILIIAPDNCQGLLHSVGHAAPASGLA